MAVRPIVRRLGPNHRSFDASFGAALKLFYPGINVFQGNQSEWQQPFRIMAAILCRPVIIRAKTGDPQFYIVQHVQRHTHGGVDRLGNHAVTVLVFQPGGWIPHTGRGLIHAFFIMFRQIFRWYARTKKRSH